ncbi:MAG: CrcB family protein [Spirochaetaceae bacterium]|nr:CrcB family protein [Spirochaetaceae bacterium]
MRKYIFIGLGGFLGSMSRSAIKLQHIFGNNQIIPFDTVLINILGSFIIAFFLTISLAIFTIDTDIKTGISVGFLGSFTTFSTFTKEAMNLLMSEHYIESLIYIVSSILLGLFFAFLGYYLAMKLQGVHYRRNTKDEI